MTGVTAPLNIGSVAWDTIEARVVQAGLRTQIELLTDLLVENGSGVLLTLDEIHQNQVDELREVAIQQRLNVNVNYASHYRLRLIAAEMIYPTHRGYVDFALPYLREFLHEHAAADI